jgi:hypothetical protein
MTTKTQLSLKNMGKPHHKPLTPSGGTGGYANARSIGTDRTRPKDIGGGTASTYYANSRSITGTRQSHPSLVGPTSYTNFVTTKKGKK